jgi:hypothetical protein
VSPRSLVVGCALLALGGGCAFQDARLQVPSANAVASDYRVGGSPAIVMAPSFVDERPDRGRCGMKKAASKPAGRVDCDTAPNQWLAKLLVDELRAAGFQVYDHEAPPGQAAVRIEGFLTQLFVEPDVETSYYMLFSGGYYLPEADIAVRLVARGASFQAERRFYVKDVGDYRGGALESNFQLALDNSTRQSLRLMVAAIGELVNLAPGFEQYACATARAVPASN